VRPGINTGRNWVFDFKYTPVQYFVNRERFRNYQRLAGAALKPATAVLKRVLLAFS